MEAIAIRQARHDLEAELPTGLPWDRITGLTVTTLGILLLTGGIAGAVLTPPGVSALVGTTLALAGVALALGGLLLTHLTSETQRRALEFEGLVEEISQELDKVNHRNDLLADAISAADMRIARLSDRLRREERERQAVAVRLEK